MFIKTLLTTIILSAASALAGLFVTWLWGVLIEDKMNSLIKVRTA